MRLPLSSSCSIWAGLPVTTTREIWLSASRWILAVSPVSSSVPWVIFTFPCRVVTVFGALYASVCLAAKFIGCWRSDCLATTSAGSMASAHAASSPAASRRLMLARRERAVAVIEQLQVMIVEVGTHADAAHSTVALGHLYGRGCFHAALPRPRGHLRGVQGSLRLRHAPRIGEGGSAQVDRPLPVGNPGLFGRHLEGGAVEVQGIVALATLDPGRLQAQAGFAVDAVFGDAGVGQGVARTRRADEITGARRRSQPPQQQLAGARGQGHQHDRDRQTPVAQPPAPCHCQCSRSASLLPCACRIRSHSSRAAPSPPRRLVCQCACAAIHGCAWATATASPTTRIGARSGRSSPR